MEPEAVSRAIATGQGVMVRAAVTEPEAVSRAIVTEPDVTARVQETVRAAAMEPGAVSRAAAMAREAASRAAVMEPDVRVRAAVTGQEAASRAEEMVREADGARAPLSLRLTRRFRPNPPATVRTKTPIRMTSTTSAVMRKRKAGLRAESRLREPLLCPRSR